MSRSRIALFPTLELAAGRSFAPDTAPPSRQPFFPFQWRRFSVTYSLVVGSIVVRTWEIRLAGKPPISAYFLRCLIRGNINTVDLVVCYVAFDPLDPRSKLLKHSTGFLRDRFESFR